MAHVIWCKCGYPSFVLVSIAQSILFHPFKSVCILMIEMSLLKADNRWVFFLLFIYLLLFESSFLMNSASLHPFIGEFSPSTLQVIIYSYVLIAMLWIISWFFLCVFFYNFFFSFIDLFLCNLITLFTGMLWFLSFYVLLIYYSN